MRPRFDPNDPEDWDPALDLDSGEQGYPLIGDDPDHDCSVEECFKLQWEEDEDD